MVSKDPGKASRKAEESELGLSVQLMLVCLKVLPSTCCTVTKCMQRMLIAVMSLNPKEINKKDVIYFLPILQTTKQDQ